MGSVELSVVIAAHDAAAVIDTCLAALEPQRRRRQVEVIVADHSTDGTSEQVVRRFPWVRLFHFDEPLTVPVLRGRALAVSQGQIVAVLDPYSVAASDWVEQVLAAHARRPHLAIGGTVGLYRADACSLARWTVYFNEYALFMPPAVGGETWIVPGSNVSYKRAALFDGDTPRYPVFWKTFVNWEIARSSALWLEPAIRVELNKPIPLAEFLRTRYDHGRCFAGMRMRGRPAAVRLLRALSAALIPPLLMWRWTRGFWPKRRHRLRFLLTLPAQLALFTVWAWGEARGYLGGSGDSCEQLFY